MQNIKNIIQSLTELIQRAKEKQLTIHDKTIIACTILATLITIILLATIQYWGIPLLAIAFLVYLFYDEFKKPNPTVKSQLPVDTVIYQCLIEVLSEIYDRIDARRPIDLMDIAVMPPFYQKNDISMLRAKIARTHQHPLTDEDLEIVKKRLQGRINDHLKQGRVPVPYISLDGNAPIIFIDAVYDNVINYLVDVVFIDTPEKLKYYYKKYGTNKHHRPKDDDKDF